MTAPLRLLALLTAATFTCGTTFAADPVPTLPELLKEYKALGLPFPPKDAKLVRFEEFRGIVYNGKVRPIIYRLAFEIKPGTTPSQTVLLQGMREWQPDWDARCREMKPEPAATTDVDLTPNDALVLSIQCQARGWGRLAENLLEKSHRGDETPQKHLLQLAWGYWFDQITDPKADRIPLVKRLKELIGRDAELDTEHHRALIRSLELALIPGQAKPGSVEALIDKLVDYNTHTGTVGVFGEPGQAYRVLVEMGFDAVPALIEHLNDDRLTRAKMMGFNNFPSWNLRVRDLVGDLIEGLADEDLLRGTEDQDVGGGWLRRQQGWAIKKAAVTRWWEKAKKEGEEKYLLARILPKPAEDHGELRLNEHLLQVIAAKYPKQIPVLYKTIVKKRRDIHSWPMADALLACPTPANEKIALLLAAAKLAGTDHQLPAFHAIKKLDRKRFDVLIVAAIEDIPKDVDTKYWSSSETYFARLAIQSYDPKVWEVIEKVARRSSLGMRMELLHKMSDAKEPRWRAERLKLLSGFLDDTEFRDTKLDNRFDGPGAGFPYDKITVRDFVAIEIMEMLGNEVELKLDRTAEEWTKLRDDVRTALKRELGKKE